MKQSPLIKQVSLIAEEIYKIAESIEKFSGDEKWRTVSKLKNAANDSLFYVAQIGGAGSGQSVEFDCIYARKDLSALRAMYVFAAKQGMVELDPNLVVRIDELIGQINKEQEASEKEQKRKQEEDLKPWLEKYRIWQKISKD